MSARCSHMNIERSVAAYWKIFTRPSTPKDYFIYHGIRTLDELAGSHLLLSITRRCQFLYFRNDNRNRSPATL